jgi:hypothetical protein
VSTFSEQVWALSRERHQGASRSRVVARRSRSAVASTLMHGQAAGDEASSAIWVPVRGRAQIILPFDPTGRSANPDWLRDVLGSRIQIHHVGGGVWEIVRNHADALLAACVDRFGSGQTTVITDAAQQQKCGPLCQNGHPANALNCQCQCGGANHGGAGGWNIYGQFAIQTDVTRRIFHV